MQKLLPICALLIFCGALEVELMGWGRLTSVFPDAWLEEASGGIFDSLEEQTEVTKAAPSPYARIPLFKSHSELSEREREVKQKLEGQLLGELPDDVITKTNGSILEGTIIAETSTQVRLEQEFRGAGKMSVWIPRSSISQIQRANRYRREVSYRDVRYQMEFPKMDLYIRPPFTVLTEKNYFDVANAVELLDGLNFSFQHQFQGVIQETDQVEGIQLLFFSEEHDFENYRDRFATNLGYSVGFYSPSTDRLVIYDQETSEQALNIVDKLDAVQAKYQQNGLRSSSQKNAATRWSRDRKQELSIQTAQITRRILRHEGAHQLFSTYGVHSAHGAEHLWLIEGLAVYCETESMGERPDHLLGGIGSGMLSFRKLVEFSDRRGFGALGNNRAIEDAYALAGLMTYVLMQPDNRRGFFEFIRILQDPDSADLLQETSQFDLLSQTLGLTPEQLEQRFRSELNRSI